MLGIDQLQDTLIAAIWEPDLEALPAWKSWAYRSLRVLYASVRDLLAGQLMLRATSLVYTTLLSLVPLLAVSFSVLKAFGVHNQIEPLLRNLLAPLGAQGHEVSDRIIAFVENMNAGVLGFVGLTFLLYTVVSLLQQVEESFNYVWHVEKQRGFAQRFTEYLSVILIGPVLVVSALGMTASILGTHVAQQVLAYQPLGEAVSLGTRLLPYLLVIAAFAFVYGFVPNTRVKVSSALFGAVVAGVLWESTGWIFGSFVVTSSRYTLIYSAFATLVLFMIWLYVSWAILLFGATMAFYFQYPEYLAPRQRSFVLSGRLKERLALASMALVVRNHYLGVAPLTLVELSAHLHVPGEALAPLIHSLERARLLARDAADPPRYLPGRPADTTAVREVLAAVRNGDEREVLAPQQVRHDPQVDRVLERLEQAVRASLEGLTLKDLAAPESTPGDVIDEPAMAAQLPAGQRRKV